MRMRARVTFYDRTVFNFGPTKFALPAVNGDVPETMQYWTMCFQHEEIVGSLEYEGDAKWLADPLPGGELKPGFRFNLWDGKVIGEGIIL